jgi:hypothetical protein
MTKRAIKDTVPTRQASPLFEYSEAEWSQIEETILAIRSGPLTEFVRDSLLQCARRYRSKILQPKSTKRRKQWQQIARQSEKLQRELVICTEQRLADLRVDWPYKEILENVRSIYDRHLEALVELQDTATAHINFYLSKGPYDFDSMRLPFDMNKPHSKFQFEILEIWWRLGGKLRLSRHPRSGKISGPTARYFFAVTRPVMGASTPSPEALPDIVARFKNPIIKGAVSNGETR